ncbi:rhodanese-like domain-containing protein [Verrucomicrobiaceae bacterium 227]
MKTNRIPSYEDEAVVTSSGPDVQFDFIEPEELMFEMRRAGLLGNLVVLEAHFSSIDHPLDPEMPVFRHLPGAVQIHPSYLEAGLNRAKYYPCYEHPTEANVLPVAELTLVLEALGITPDSCVVVYGSDPDGVMAAARLVWGLMYAGVRSVRFLDGGIEAWVAKGGETDFEVKTVWEVAGSHVVGERSTWTVRPEHLMSGPGLQRFVREDRLAIERLVDVRTEGEWSGAMVKKYPFFSRGGHIPKAIHQGDWNNLMDGTSRSLRPHLEVVARRWREQGIIDAGVESGATTLIFYCGTGWRSSIAFLVAHLLGFKARNFDDGFYGWSFHPENEVVVE